MHRHVMGSDADVAVSNANDAGPEPGANPPSLNSHVPGNDASIIAPEGDVPAPDADTIFTSPNVQDADGKDRTTSVDNANQHTGGMPARRNARNKRYSENGLNKSQAAGKRARHHDIPPGKTQHCELPDQVLHVVRHAKPSDTERIANPDSKHPVVQGPVRTIFAREIERTDFILTFLLIGSGYYIIRDGQGRPCRDYSGCVAALESFSFNDPRHLSVPR
ncbi:hypothetical protein N657DRAFT_177537 [Parathielavia appendiculata]|uniref:Uncharacterized protein n=1 Tax=Parathielavia appendiculata TaxID=2587402 RepID=A0AAN6Z5U5_9PEZI|nr:hypothetical protein N657DRAFT_177537 [Parathielavia appendiculata]